MTPLPLCVFNKLYIEPVLTSRLFPFLVLNLGPLDRVSGPTGTSRLPKRSFRGRCFTHPYKHTSSELYIYPVKEGKGDRSGEFVYRKFEVYNLLIK